MTKRLLSVVIAILMVLAVVPMSVFAAESDQNVPVTFSAEPYGFDGTFTDPKVGDTFKVAYKISEQSGSWSGVLYSKIDDRYITTIGYETERDDCLTVTINDAYDNDEECFDNTLVVMGTPDLNYHGGTGTDPVGEEGEVYSCFLWYSYTKDGSDGLQSGGILCVVEYQWVAVPESSIDLDFDIVCKRSDCDFMGLCHQTNVTCEEFSCPVTVSGPVDRSINFSVEALPVNTASGTPAAAATFENPTVGDYVWLYLNIETPEGGNWSGFHGYIDFDERFFNPTANSSSTTSNFLPRIISNMWSANDYSSDKPVFNLDTDKVGGAFLEEGSTNHISNIVACVMDYQPYTHGAGFPGVTVNGYGFRIKYTLTAVPDVADLQKEGDLYYMEVPFILVVTDAAQGLVDASYLDVDPAHTILEGSDFGVFNPANITIANVKLYFNITEAPATRTITYTINGEEYATRTYEVGAPVTAPDYTVPTGYTFSGWTLPATMPAEDITLDATLTPNQYQVTINYLRWSDDFEDWVDAQSSKTFTVTYGEQYDYNDQIPAEIDVYEYDHLEGAIAGTMGAGNVVVNAYYVKPYEPAAPTVASTRVELRERATEDAKKDMRFVFTVTFNDANVNYNGAMVGADPAYFEITALGANLTVGSKTVNVPAKNIYKMYDATFEFTAVITGITEGNWATTVTAVPYMTYTNGAEAITVNGNAIEVTVNSLLGGE